MKSDAFAALMASAEEALAHAKGKQQLRTTVLPGAPKLMTADDVRALREQVNASQAVFAHFLNVSTKLVQAWECSRRRPEGAALRLLEIAERDPQIVFRGLALAGTVRETSDQSARSAARGQRRSIVSKSPAKAMTLTKRKRASA